VLSTTIGNFGKWKLQASYLCRLKFKGRHAVKKQIHPMFSTTVDPSEYDIDEQMERMVKQSNKNRECFTEMDVGKVWGLYLAWKRLLTAEKVP